MAEKKVDPSEAEEEKNTYQEPFRKRCSHYSRGCSLVAPCCDKVYPCRVCHNEKETHEVDRFAVKEIVCRNCNERQPVAKTCHKCSLTFARYSCFVCNLFDDSEKGQYHCVKCGICRIGGRDNFFHCETCGLCLQSSLKDSHKCVQQASHSNCPVCMEDLHSSRTAAHVPKCGHLLHNTCFQDMIKNNLYQCPQCQTSLIDMSSQWETLDRERQQWMLPYELRNFKVKVQCRDCQKEDETKFHFVGLKCSSCGSYNTVRCGNEVLPLDDVDPTNLMPHPLLPLLMDSDDEEEEEEEEDDNIILEMLEHDILNGIPTFEIPSIDSDSDDDSAEYFEAQDYEDEGVGGEEDIVFQMYPPFFQNNVQGAGRGDGGGDMLSENDFMELINALPHLLNLHDDNDFDLDENHAPLPPTNNSFFYFGGGGGSSHDFLPYPPGNNMAATLNGPQIWEVTDEEEEDDENIVTNNGEGDEWETSSEEEIIGGDEENLGKEECLIPEEEENNQLGDVAPAN